MSKFYTRHAILPLDEVMPHLHYKGVSKRKIVEPFHGVNVKMTSDRYDNLLFHEPKCVVCGLEATHAAIERARNESTHYHFNFYGYREEKEIMITLDHVLPKSLGGKNEVRNYQVMCEHCNQKKGNKRAS